MNNLTELFKIIELTRSQPQYGYALAGIKKADLSDLAQHHYLVAFIAWQLALNLESQGIKINVLKVLEFALVHDLGELFGGDIAMPYAKANPKARELAKAFEAENQNYLSKFFGNQQSHFHKLTEEVMDAKSDEGIVAKLADYIEVAHYKQYMGLLTKGDVTMSYNAMLKKVMLMNNLQAKKYLKKLILNWKKEIGNLNNEFFEKIKIQT